MAEGKKKPVQKKTAASKPTTIKRNSAANAAADDKFYTGMGNEITGSLLIGVGLFMTASIFTDKIGRLGEWLKAAVFAAAGFTAYLVPVLLLVWGFSFIIRKSGLFAGRRTMGVLISLVSLAVILSLKTTYLGDELGFPAALTAISNLTDHSHGGIIGFALAYPIEKLVGAVGTYIFSGLGIILGSVLLFDTTLYDSLKKGKDAGESINAQWKEKLAERKLKAEAEQKAEDKAALLNKLEVPVIKRQNPQAAEAGSPQEEPLSLKGFKFGPREKSEEDAGKLKLPTFSRYSDESKPLTFAGDGKNQSPGNKYNIEVKTPVPSGNPKGDPASWGVAGNESFGGDDRVVARKGKTGLELSDIQTAGDGPEPLEYNFSENKPAENKPIENKPIENKPSENKPIENKFDSDGAVSGGNPSGIASEGIANGQETGRVQGAGRPEQGPQAMAGGREDALDLQPMKGKQISVDDPEAKKKLVYNYPGLALLKENIKGMIREDDRLEIMENAQKLQDILKSFSIDATVIHVSKGPTVTRYELQPKPGIKVSKIVGLSDDIAMGLAASGVRIEAPIPGKGAVGIEIPNKETSPVFLREVIDSDKFNKSTQKLAIALGKDISGESIVGDLTRFPHVLIAGATGSGKSVCINSLIVSLLYKYTPEEVRLIMVDPKMVELSVYNGIPHLLIPVVTDPKKAAGALNWAVNEMTRRYKLFADNGVKNIDGYNDLKAKGKIEEKLPYIVIIVDELADLMMVAANEVENYVMRLAQMARAAGMHLVIATQRPSVDVITGVIKANIPSRISFAVSSYVDSKTILDQGGAEKLLGKGDMLYCPVGVQKAKRIQGAFISEEEVEAIVAHIKVVADEVQYDTRIIQHIEAGSGDENGHNDGSDELLDEAIRIVVENKQASTSYLQRRMRIGYNRAARIVDELEQTGVISGPDGSKPRRVIWTMEDLKSKD